MTRSGAQLFARYAYPPNELGYCGPDDASVLLGRGIEAEAQIELHARQFEGAWSYLELIAAAAHIDDPLDPRVVEAYWLGNELLELIDDAATPQLLRERLPPQSGAMWGRGLAHHGYHVFAVYPWTRLLFGANGNAHAAATALRVLDQCRIRWGTVTALDGDRAIVRCRPLAWHDATLVLGEPAAQSAAIVVDGRSLLAGETAPAVGDDVAMHWDWVCDVLQHDQLAALERCTEDQLARVNAMALG